MYPVSTKLRYLYQFVYSSVMIIMNIYMSIIVPHIMYIQLLMSSIYSVRVSASNDEAGFGTIATVNVVTGTVCVFVTVVIGLLILYYYTCARLVSIQHPHFNIQRDTMITFLSSLSLSFLLFLPGTALLVDPNFTVSVSMVTAISAQIDWTVPEVNDNIQYRIQIKKDGKYTIRIIHFLFITFFYYIIVSYCHI